MAGVGLLPMLGSAAIGSMLGGMISGKKNNIFPVLVTASGLMAIGCGFLSTITSVDTGKKVYGFQVLVGFGFGLTVSNVTMLAVLESERKDHAVAQGIMAQARVLGGSIGIAASTAILGVTEGQELSGIPQSAIASLQSSRDSLTRQQYRAIQQAYADSFSEIMRVTAIIACVTFVFSLATYQRHPMTMAENARLKMQQYSDEAAREHGDNDAKDENVV